MKLHNRTPFTLPGGDWIQITPLGEFPHATGVMQVVDLDAIANLAANFTEEILLDFDHESEDPSKRTMAAGWIVELEARHDGLYGRVRWSNSGRAAVTGGEYRSLSPVWDVEWIGDPRMNRARPMRLLRAGLTNRPNIRSIKKISNREQSATDGEQPGGSPTATAATNEKQQMKLINRVLDLSPDASEEAAIAGIEKIKTERANAQASLATATADLATARETLANREKKITELEGQIQAANETAIEQQLDQAGLKDAERATYKALLLANRETGTDALKALVAARDAAKAATHKPLHNREGAKVPGDRENQPTELTRETAKAAFRAQLNNSNE